MKLIGFSVTGHYETAQPDCRDREDESCNACAVFEGYLDKAPCRSIAGYGIWDKDHCCYKEDEKQQEYIGSHCEFESKFYYCPK